MKKTDLIKKARSLGLKVNNTWTIARLKAAIEKKQAKLAEPPMVDPRPAIAPPPIDPKPIEEPSADVVLPPKEVATEPPQVAPPQPKPAPKAIAVEKILTNWTVTFHGEAIGPNKELAIYLPDGRVLRPKPKEIDKLMGLGAIRKEVVG